MADVKISELSSASALDGTEEVPAVQSSSTVKTTARDIKTYVQSEPKFVVELIDDTTVDFYAPFAMSIDTVTNIVNSPTTTLELNGSAYTLTDPISQGDLITVTVDVAGVIILNATK